MWTNKDGNITNGILPLDHVKAMVEAMKGVPGIHIDYEYYSDDDTLQSVIATISNKAKTKTKEIFRALVGTTGKYLCRYRTDLFTRVM